MHFKYSTLVIALSSLCLCSVSFAQEASDIAEDNTQKLPTLVVSASLKEQDVSKAPASISVVTSEEIAKSASTTIAEVLQRQPGVVNYNTGQDKIAIRGMRDTSGSYTLILLNGKRMSSLGAMWRGNDFDWNSLPLNSIERIEIIRGPMSSLYGSDAIGGVINIIIKKPELGKISGSAYAQYNRMASGAGKDQYSTGVSLRGGLTDSLSFALSGSVTHKDAWYRGSKNDTDGAYFVEKQTKALAGTLSWDFTPQQSLDFDLALSKDELPFTRDGNGTYAEMSNERVNAGLTHKGNWDWGTTEFYVGHEVSDIDDYDSEYDTPQSRQYKQENTIVRGFSNFDWWINNTTLGADFKNQEVTDTVSYASGGNKQKSYGVFVQNDTHLTDDLTLTLGGRYDDYSNFDGKFTGKAYLAYQLYEGVVLKGGWGQAYKAPSPYQLDPNYSMISCGGDCYISGNPDLKPEESNSYEASVIVTQPNWNFSATYFNNDVKNLIERVTDPLGTDIRPYKWDNISRARLRGVELAAGYQFTDALSFNSNATYLDAINKQTKAKLTERPEWVWNNTLSWALHESFKANVSANYVGRQALSTTRDLPSYTTYDLVFNSKVSKDVTFDYGVKNLTDVVLEDKDTGFNTKLYGRNYFVKLTYNF